MNATITLERMERQATLLDRPRERDPIGDVLKLASLDRRLRDVPGAGYLVPPTKNPGDALTSALWNSYIRDNLDFGMVRPIADIILGAPAASFDFTSIAATFAHLLLVATVRSDVASAQVTCTGLRLNNDSAGNYDRSFNANQAGTFVGGDEFAQTGVRCSAPGSTATANFFGFVVYEIWNYAGATAQKIVGYRNAYEGSAVTGNFGTYYGAGRWASTAAVNRTTLVANGNFIAGSRATLYGMGGI